MLAQLTTIQSNDPDIRRRSRIALQIGMTMTVVALVFIPVTLFLLPQTQNSTITLLIAAGSFFITAMLARSGRATAAAFLIIGVFMLATLGSMVMNLRDQILTSGVYLSATIVIAGLTLRPAYVWLVVAANVIGVSLVFSTASVDMFNDPMVTRSIVNTIGLLVITGGIAFLGAQVSSQIIAELQDARAQAEHTQQALAETNAGLENSIAARTSELRQMLAAQQALAEELQSSLSTQQELSQIIADLSLPIIPVRDGTVVVPLSGSIDSARASKLIGNVLETLEQRKIALVIFDITGVPIVDTQVAQVLLQTASATRLMGAETILVGIRPEVAQTLVGLGVDLRTLRTAATLQEGLTFNIQRGIAA